MAKTFQALSYWPFYSILKFFTHYKVYGQENLKGLEKGPIIFASNHASYVDGPICAAAMPRYKGELYPKTLFPIRFLASGRYFKWQYFPISWYVHLNGSIKVWKGTGRPLKEVLKETIIALNNNQHVWIYPEGKRTPDGRLGQGKRGVACLHQETGAPIVPVAIKSTLDVLSPKTLLGTKILTAHIGKPIYSLGNVSLEEGTAKVMQAIGEVFDQENSTSQATKQPTQKPSLNDIIH